MIQGPTRSSVAPPWAAAAQITALTRMRQDINARDNARGALARYRAMAAKLQKQPGAATRMKRALTSAAHGKRVNWLG